MLWLLTMNIGSGNGYPEASLSNFSPHRFVIDDVICSSMEGFLQSLKFSNPEMQKEVCKLIGKQAKYKGKHKKWWRTQTLYWQGKEYARNSEEYQTLLDRAYRAMFEQSESFRKALKASGSATLEHTIGRTKSSETILTQQEFCSRLTKLREELN
jgi:trimethylamine:corrinoid methyltransferase-like protein